MTWNNRYFDAICWSALPTALVAVFSGFFTGLGVTRTVMWINAVGLVVNVIFDYLFIFGRLGFHAALPEPAYATVLANWASASSVPISYLNKHEVSYRVRLRLALEQGPSPSLHSLRSAERPPMGARGSGIHSVWIFVGRFENGDAALANSSTSR